MAAEAEPLYKKQRREKAEAEAAAAAQKEADDAVATVIVQFVSREGEKSVRLSAL
jgi:hypothetical protein